MKILKIILIAVVSVVVIALVAALFIKNDYAIVREVTINKPKAEVFAYAKMIRNQDNYSYWNMKDPGRKTDSKGTDGTVGFVMSWDSQDGEVGQGEMEIKNITEGDRIDMELRFMRPFKATDMAFMSTEAVSEAQTKVKWGFNGHMAYPKNLMLAMMNMDEMLGKRLQEGLNTMKTILEK